MTFLRSPLLLAALALVATTAPGAGTAPPVGANAGPGSAAAPSDDDALTEARALARKKQWERAAELLDERMRRRAATLEHHQLYAEVLGELGRDDEAAFQAELALELLHAVPADASATKRRRALERTLRKADPHARARTELFSDAIGTSLDVAERLLDADDAARALAVLERALTVASCASARDARILDELLVRARAAFEEVDLEGDARDTAGEPGPKKRKGPVEAESEHYRFVCDLEPEVVERLGVTMDDVFGHYVEVYFGGDAKRVDGRKATVRVYADRASMMEHWPDKSAGVEGWWSPGEWQVTCYDTRDTAGTLDAMLETLFHEASHQFTSMRTARGGHAPSWLNEGTASFFEGTRAMADHRVLWPEAAVGRLQNLASNLRRGDGPTVEEVLAFPGPGSYPGEYYAFGWGLVYFLQEFEDPDSLERVWRPYYDEYTERITTRGGDSRALFDEIFLRAGNPGGFADLDAFVQAWRAWILDDVYELLFGRERIERRRARLAKYVERAALVGADAKRVEVGSLHESLLLRALAELEFLLSLENELDAALEVELALQELDVLHELGRAEAEAAGIERLLDRVDAGRIALDEARASELEERMLGLDARNAPARLLRQRRASYARRAHKILAAYADEGDAFALRAADFARVAGAVLDDDALTADAARLREAAVKLGRIPSRVVDIEGPDWVTVFQGNETRFSHATGRVEFAIAARPGGRICTSAPLDGEYEVRGELEFEGEVYRSSFGGLVVAGSPKGDWIAVGVGAGNELVVKRCVQRPDGSTVLRNETSWRLGAPIDGPFSLAVRLSGNELRARLADGTEHVAKLEPPPASPAFAGILVKDAGLVVRDLVAEVFP